MLSEPIERAVVLGASNVRRGLTAVVSSAQGLSRQPVDVLLAMGHGRSYGRWSSVPGRALPGILQCQLWDALAQSQDIPTAAVLTDVGNDLLYEVQPDRLVGWVATCVDRLLAHGAQIALTELPLASLSQLGETRYKLFRTFFFPACRLTLDEITCRAHEVTTGLRRLANERGIRVVKPDKAWYGFDPIHIKRQQNVACWEIFFRAATNKETLFRSERLSLLARCHLAMARPAQRKLLGWLQERVQPSVALSSGATISIF